MRVSLDDVKGINRFTGLDRNAGLLEDFPFRGLLQGFTQLDASTRNGPLAGIGGFVAFDQQDPVLLKDDGANTHLW